ncbi:hypothetical protein N657DRAFT_692649 [Parathielavia appendiculata]|uniref:Transcription activator GCR1-like domain-containing protein n=1 Tax=Parathielavia appendiculata TaxID=2587402 RepID=A0AAN6TU28_9PEZI|nr:hypothetical protein N657DRAFT_692649 [Parathielavia appendiculata]
MPVLADYLKSIDARNEARAAELKNELLAATAAQTAQLQTLLTAGFTFEVKAAVSQAAAAAILLPVEERRGSRYTSAQSSINASRSTSPSPVPGRFPAGSYDTHTPAPELRPDTNPDPELQPPQYSMCRAIKTVEGLWREWTVGLSGRPAIAALDRKWGNR